MASLSDLHKAHVFSSWVAQDGPAPVTVEGGLGCWFWDSAGKRYLDFSSQRVNLNLGHQHPRMVAAIQEQAGKLCTLAQVYASEPRSLAAELIASKTPGDLDRIFFTNCGSEAVEHAVRMAKVFTGRSKIVTTYRSYHGSTASALSYSGDPRRWSVEPAMPGVVRIRGPYLYRSSFNSLTEAEECQRSLAHLEESLMFEGPENIAAVLLESIVGTNGLLVPPSGYLQGVRQLCDDHGIVMICDEVMAGFGRSGEWFSVDHWNVTPDLICFAKGVNSGYIPVGGVAVNSKIYDYYRKNTFPGGGTYYGHPLACATIVESIRIFEDEHLIDRSARIGREILGPGLLKLQQKHPCVGEVRGRGCFWALELVKNRDTREMLVPFNAKGSALEPIKMFTKECVDEGLCLLTHENRIHIYPPLVVSDEEVEIALGIIDQALYGLDRYVDN